MRGRGRAASLGLLASVVAGCGILFPPFPVEEPWEEPERLATYRTGGAEIRLGDGTTVVLDTVARGSVLLTEFGSSVRWTNADGWHVRVEGAGETTYGSDAYVVFDRIVGVEHWTTYDESRCIVDIELADRTAIRGSATCRGVEWVDALDYSFMDAPAGVGQPTFDAELTFEAVP